MPRKKKKIYKNIVLKNVKSYDDLTSNIAIRIERGVGGRKTFRYVNETICTPTEKGENKPWGYCTIAKPNEEYEGEYEEQRRMSRRRTITMAKKNKKMIQKKRKNKQHKKNDD